MSRVRDKIIEISTIISDITETARSVNSDSHERKNITTGGLEQIDELLSGNKTLIVNFDKIFA